MKLEQIKSDHAPKAIGPYSHGMCHGNLIITSGQIPLDPDTNEMVTEIKAATSTVLNNLLSIVEAAGGKKDTIAKVDIFVSTLDDFAAINEVYRAFFGDHKPARVLVEVGKLPAGAKLEAAMTAFVAD